MNLHTVFASAALLAASTSAIYSYFNYRRTQKLVFAQDAKRKCESWNRAYPVGSIVAIDVEPSDPATGRMLCEHQAKPTRPKMKFLST